MDREFDGTAEHEEDLPADNRDIDPNPNLGKVDIQSGTLLDPAEMSSEGSFLANPDRSGGDIDQKVATEDEVHVPRDGADNPDSMRS